MLEAEVIVDVTALDNTVTRKCQMWGFFLFSVPWFGLCCFPATKHTGGFRAQNLQPDYKEENGGLGDGVKESEKLWTRS